MLYLRRVILALVLWVAAAAVAILAIRSTGTNPCAPHGGSSTSWFIVGAGLFTAAGVFQSLRRSGGLDRRTLAAAFLAVGLGAVASFGLWFLLLMNWVSHCAN
jgi:hypothetical protein